MEDKPTNHNAMDYEELLRNALIRIQSLNARVAASSEPIAIIGMGSRFSGGANTLEDFWDLLQRGGDGISEVPANRWDINHYYNSDPDVPGKMITKLAGFLNVDVSQFDPAFFGISPKEAEYLDPQQRLLLEVSYEALQSAGIAPSTLVGSLTGVFIGICTKDYYDLIVSTQDKDLIGPYVGTGNAFSTASGRLSFFLGLQGPNIAVETACSSSLVVVDQACQSLRSGEVNLALAGGVNLLLSPDAFINFSKAGMLAPDGHCKTFDERANGYARGEGCGVVVLKRLSDAVRDRDTIYGVIEASGVNQDGASSSLTVPNGLAQETLLQTVLKKAGLKADEIDFVEAHGTGTSLGDPIELRALGAVYGQRDKSKPLLLGSVKTNIGHTEAAAGIAGLIKTVLSLYHEHIPGILHFKKINSLIKADFPFEIVTQLTPWKKGEHIRRAAVSSFGFSGTNAHVILREGPAEFPIQPAPERPYHILTLSAKTEAALEALIIMFQNYLSSSKEYIGDIVFTANVGRDHFKYRMAIVAKDKSEFSYKLKQRLFVICQIKTKKESTVCLDTLGQDADWEKLLLELAKDYEEGASIDWKQLDAIYQRKKLLLPTYPFQRQTYWLESIKSTKNTRQDDNMPIADLLYEWAWKEHAVGEVSVPDPLGDWLVLGDGSVSDVVVSLFEAKGGRCRRVTFTGQARSKKEFIALIQEQPISGLLHIINREDFTIRDLIKTQEIGIKSALHLCQALLELRDSIKLPLYFVTEDITGSNVAQSPLFSFCKTVQAEHPDLDIKLIDLDPSWKSEAFLPALFSKEKESLISLRGDQRYVPRLARLQDSIVAEQMSMSHNKIRSDATYIITGGLGGIGLVLAAWLIDKGAGGIVLTGRKPIDDEIRSILQGLVTEGTQVVYAEGDVADEVFVRALINNIEPAEKPLKGIFHLAGTYADATLMNQNWSFFQTVFAPKVYGGFYLHHYAKNLDLFVMFSSMASTFGSRGQSNYAAANGFLDVLCTYRKKQGLPALSLSWGTWAEVGMGKHKVTQEAEAGMLALQSREALLALETALFSQQAHITIANINWKRFIKLWVETPTWLALFSQDKAESANLLAELEMIPESGRLNRIKIYLCELLSVILKFPDSLTIDENITFFELGMDSLSMADLQNNLQRDLGARFTLSSEIVLNYPTVCDLAGAVFAITSQPVNSIMKEESDEASRKTSTWMSTLNSSEWIIREKPRHEVKVRVFCFHHIGGSAGSFRGWQGQMPEGVELCFIQLPGREQRHNEPFIGEIAAVVHGIIHSMLNYMDQPYIFFGQSLGAMLAFEVTEGLQRLKLPLPQHLILSGSAPLYFTPERPIKFQKIQDLDDKEFIDVMVETVESIPEQIINDPTTLARFLPILRADLALVCQPFIFNKKLGIPVTTIYCEDDKTITENEIKLWEKATESTYHNVTVPGGHMVLLSNPKSYLDMIIMTLSPFLNK